MVKLDDEGTCLSCGQTTLLDPDAQRSLLPNGISFLVHNRPPKPVIDLTRGAQCKGVARHAQVVNVDRAKRDAEIAKLAGALAAWFANDRRHRPIPDAAQCSALARLLIGQLWLRHFARRSADIAYADITRTRKQARDLQRSLEKFKQRTGARDHTTNDLIGALEDWQEVYHGVGDGRRKSPHEIEVLALPLIEKTLTDSGWPKGRDLSSVSRIIAGLVDEFLTGEERDSFELARHLRRKSSK